MVEGAVIVFRRSGVTQLVVGNHFGITQRVPAGAHVEAAQAAQVLSEPEVDESDVNSLSTETEQLC